MFKARAAAANLTCDHPSFVRMMDLSTVATRCKTSAVPRIILIGFNFCKCFKPIIEINYSCGLHGRI